MLFYFFALIPNKTSTCRYNYATIGERRAASRGGGGALPIYCSIPMHGPQGYDFWETIYFKGMLFIVYCLKKNTSECCHQNVCFDCLRAYLDP